MAVPAPIKITRIPDSETHWLRIFQGCQQFIGSIAATLPEPMPDDWEARKRWYAILHRFDPWGDHLGTEARFAGTTADGEDQVLERARGWLREMVGGLGKVMFCDVEVRLFSAEIDGQTFGLVDASGPDWGQESVHLVPGDLAFFEPWDGSWDT